MIRHADAPGTGDPAGYKLGLNGAVPDHSTFSKNRHGRFRESDLLRKLFGEPSLLVWVIARVVRQNSAIVQPDATVHALGKV